MTAPILIVDDDAGVRATIARILEDESYEVVEATDGIDALATLDGLLPALILLDLTMPRMDGWEFVAEVERLGLRSSIPLVVLTADGHARQKATQLGADGYLPKPFDVDALIEVITRLTS
jgi:CheY-like chemotaxis protein